MEWIVTVIYQKNNHFACLFLDSGNNELKELNKQLSKRVSFVKQKIYKTLKNNCMALNAPIGLWVVSVFVDMTYDF